MSFVLFEGTTALLIETSLGFHGTKARNAHQIMWILRVGWHEMKRKEGEM